MHLTRIYTCFHLQYADRKKCSQIWTSGQRTTAWSPAKSVTIEQSSKQEAPIHQSPLVWKIGISKWRLISSTDANWTGDVIGNTASGESIQISTDNASWRVADSQSFACPVCELDHS